MKTIIMAMIVALIVLAGAVDAMPSPPTAIYGSVKNEGNIQGIPITITNMRTDVRFTIKLDARGYYQFVPANMELGFDSGDSFTIEVEGTTADVETVEYGELRRIDIDLTGTCIPIICQVCPDPTICPDPIVCDDCPEPVVCPEPEPITDNRAIEWLLAAIAGAGVSGTAVTLALGKKAQHFHRGIRNKHSLLTRHRDSDIRHPIGKATPIYKKIGDKWVYSEDE